MDRAAEIILSGNRSVARPRLRRSMLGLGMTVVLLITSCSTASTEDDVIARLLEATDADLASICAGASLPGTTPPNESRSGPGVIINLAELPEEPDQPVTEYREAVVAGHQNPDIYGGTHNVTFGTGDSFDYDDEWGWIAENYSAIETIVCLDAVPMDRESSWRRTCGYKRAGPPHDSYALTIYQQDIEMRALVASTGELITSTILQGGSNRECPGGGAVQFNRTEIPSGPDVYELKSAIARVFGGFGSD